MNTEYTEYTKEEWEVLTKNLIRSKDKTKVLIFEREKMKFKCKCDKKTTLEIKKVFETALCPECGREYKGVPNSDGTFRPVLMVLISNHSHL